MNAEAVHDVGTVDGDGVDAKIELGGDFLVGFAGNDVLKNFQFAAGEARFTFTFQSFDAPDLRIDDGFARGNGFDGVGEIQVHGVFQDVAARSGLESLADQ